MSDDPGLRDRLLEKNAISDNYFQDDQQSDSMVVERWPCCHGTAWVYSDENGNQFFEKQLSEDDIAGDHLDIPRRLAHYIQSLKGWKFAFGGRCVHPSLMN
ncbi:hypothetical protein RND71_032571 [Anisodus tanguticus]|uniref:Uncharacterized protein n=1 Tax=Anisodus tanguticus TaxID=243964 RepID=A0AAE1R9G1_9SOLA|nr:hypothetical protein RND71_032571 [Anisodus tanguticus]